MQSFEPENNDEIRFELNGKQITPGLPHPENSETPVAINFGALLPLLEEAIVSGRHWVKDFIDEEVHISSDLFDVIQAFRYFNTDQQDLDFDFEGNCG